jgi:hypothetical protein
MAARERRRSAVRNAVAGALALRAALAAVLARLQTGLGCLHRRQALVAPRQLLRRLVAPATGSMRAILPGSLLLRLPRQCLDPGLELLLALCVLAWALTISETSSRAFSDDTASAGQANACGEAGAQADRRAPRYEERTFRVAALRATVYRPYPLRPYRAPVARGAIAGGRTVPFSP